jgi:hypothetical protein
VLSQQFFSEEKNQTIFAPGAPLHGGAVARAAFDGAPAAAT